MYKLLLEEDLSSKIEKISQETRAPGTEVIRRILRESLARYERDTKYKASIKRSLGLVW